MSAHQVVSRRAFLAVVPALVITALFPSAQRSTNGLFIEKDWHLINNAWHKIWKYRHNGVITKWIGVYVGREYPTARDCEWAESFATEQAHRHAEYLKELI